MKWNQWQAVRPCHTNTCCFTKGCHGICFNPSECTHAGVQGFVIQSAQLLNLSGLLSPNLTSQCGVPTTPQHEFIPRNAQGSPQFIKMQSHLKHRKVLLMSGLEGIWGYWKDMVYKQGALQIALLMSCGDCSVVKSTHWSCRGPEFLLGISQLSGNKCWGSSADFCLYGYYTQMWPLPHTTLHHEVIRVITVVVLG